MRQPSQSTALLAACLALSGCAASHTLRETQLPRPPRPAREVAKITDSAAKPTHSAHPPADLSPYPLTTADIEFVTGMIVHHSQAIRISQWAETHGADPSVRRLAERIINGQEDEIHLMRQWLVDKGHPFDTAEAQHAVQMPGMHSMSQMPGMLSPSQLEELDRAHGADFDRLFLQLMIQHHRGALTMVRKLISTQGAAQDQTVFKIASDVDADQSTEIARMQSMLVSLTSHPPDP